MAFLTALATVATIAGTAVGIAGTISSMNAQKKAEKLRERQMNLEATRQKRGVVREANPQGSQLGTGLAGAQAQTTAGAANSIQGIRQGQEIGAGIFAANRQDAAGRMLSSFGSGLTSLAGSLQSSQDPIRRQAEYYGV
jgi:hypothetical protein